ncbi:O-antigen ligase family protein [Kineococcus rubinsiae]|uniref:O-antigen ligase family protein n=1 Tax=Kineococcus rubinsiae TaxID=2609562 RepID=UPI0014319CE9|nr:O-antigen ligase family protein [Kineococcus rubinsiae]NIZ92033.1 O-antigen ligase family protein [Kineococcus rubinsiae]
MHTAIAALCVAATALAADVVGVGVVPHLLVLACFFESVGVGSVTVGRMLAVVGIAAVVVRYRPGSIDRVRLDRRIWIPVAVLVTVQVATGLWAQDTAGWLFALGQTALALAFFATFATLVRTPRQVRGLLRTYVLGASFAVVVGCAQALTGARAAGLQGDANIYAMYQVAAVPAAVTLAATSDGPRGRRAWAATVVALTASVVASESRGGYVALVLTAIVLAVQRTRPELRVRVFLALAAAIAVVGWAGASTSDRFDLSRIENDRASGRFDIWVVAWHTFTQHPWTGVGAGGFKRISVQMLTTDPGVRLVDSHLLLLPDGIEVHSIYLEALAERGLLGGVGLSWLLVATTYVLLRPATWWRDPRLAALPAMLAAFASASFFLSVPNSKLLWMLVGLAAAVGVDRPQSAPAPRRGSSDAPGTSSASTEEPA